MRNDESHFNVSVESDGQSHRTVSTNYNIFLKRKESRSGIEPRPSAYQPNALPLGQTGSREKRPVGLSRVPWCDTASEQFKVLSARNPQLLRVVLSSAREGQNVALRASTAARTATTAIVN